MKFILCADLHLRPDRPRCRKDEDWVDTQLLQLNYIANTARLHKLPVVVCGDIFHKSQVPDYIKTMFLRAFDGVNIHILAGQHDLPYHSWDRVDSSSFGILWQMRGVININSILSLGSYAHFGQEIERNKNSNCLFIHELVFNSLKDIPPNVRAATARNLVEIYPGYKYIFCGDNHHGFITEVKGTTIIMAGCMNRQATNFRDYEPKIWIIDTEKNTIENEFIPDPLENLVDDEVLKEYDNRKERIGAFVEQVKGAKSISLDFEENVKEAMKENDFSKSEVSMIQELMEGA